MALHPDGKIIHRDLAAHPPSAIDADWIGAISTSPDALSREQAERLALSDELINELERADEYVIGVAMHNFSIPGVLKLWIDQIVRRGWTFGYSEQRPKGFLEGKKATIIVASGGIYERGTPAAAMNHLDPYLKTILAFIGVTDVKYIAAGGTATMMSSAADRPTFLKPILEEVRTAAA
jgi:FMN-dependent NADH-azoreductase